MVHGAASWIPGTMDWAGVAGYPPARVPTATVSSVAVPDRKCPVHPRFANLAWQTSGAMGGESSSLADSQESPLVVIASQDVALRMRDNKLTPSSTGDPSPEVSYKRGLEKKKPFADRSWGSGALLLEELACG